MRSLVPRADDDPNDLSPWQVGRARRIAAGAELEVFRHTVRAQAMAAMDAADSQALADAARAALDEELRLFDEGIARAGTSQTKLALVSQKLALVSQANNARLARRFTR